MTVDRPPLPGNKLLTRILIFLILLAAFLSFSIQPMVGKLLLPNYGGSAEVWLASITFFQLALLAGYSLAAWLGAASGTHAGLYHDWAGGLGLGLNPLFPDEQHDRLSRHFLYPFYLDPGRPCCSLLVFRRSCIAGCMAKSRGVPYYLACGISNAGSLAGLLLYPFVF